MLVFSTAFCLITGMFASAILMAIIFIVLTAIFYWSRVKGKLAQAIVVFSFASNFLFVVNFYFNSGINGPTILIFILTFFLNISIVSKKQYLFWILLNLTIVFSLLTLSYLYPEKIPFSYPDRLSRHIDWAYSYVVIVFLVFIITVFIQGSRDKERRITEQKALELQNANDTKDKLFSILAHDLRSPLNSIKNYLEILSEIDLTEEEQRLMRNELIVSTRYTEQMLSNLLSWSQNQMSGIAAVLISLNIAETLSSTIRIQKSAADSKGVQLVDRLNPADFIIADPEMFTLVVRNLINNAIKFTPSGGMIELSSIKEGNYICLVIKDNGNGIPSDVQDTIFSPGIRSTYGTNNEKGVGLGLMLCKEFTEAQGGKIGFESREGAGTTFFLTFKTYFLTFKTYFE